MRTLALVLISAVAASAQIRWKCDPKDGKFNIAFDHGNPFYCWDGQIFSKEPGYTPPPAYVLEYFEEQRRKSEQIRAEIARKGKELEDKVHQAQQNTARMNQERQKSHEEFMADLNRRVAASKAGHPVPTPYLPPPELSGPRTIVVKSDEPAAALPPVARARVSEALVGMDRAAVEQLLGKPHGSMTVPEDDKLIESLTYTLDDRGSARIRIENGKVVSVKVE